MVQSQNTWHSLVHFVLKMSPQRPFEYIHVSVCLHAAWNHCRVLKETLIDITEQTQDAIHPPPRKNPRPYYCSCSQGHPHSIHFLSQWDISTFQAFHFGALFMHIKGACATCDLPNLLMTPSSTPLHPTLLVVRFTPQWAWHVGTPLCMAGAPPWPLSLCSPARRLVHMWAAEAMWGEWA